MKRIFALLLPALFLLPVLALAQAPTPDATAVTSYITAFQNVVSAAVPFVIAVAVLAILIGLAQYAFAAGDEAKQKNGRQTIVVGVIILFVMVALWGFVNILLGFFFSDGVGDIPDTNLTP